MKDRNLVAVVGVTGALALVALLGADWYHADYGELGGKTVTGWMILHGGDIAISLLASLAALALVVGGRAANVVALLSAVAALAIVLYHVIDPPGTTQDVTLRAGIWLALVAVLVLAGAAAVAVTRERRRS